jgi:hypothetical protein
MRRFVTPSPKLGFAAETAEHAKRRLIATTRIHLGRAYYRHPREMVRLTTNL